jgi:hypothetical protein
MVMETCPKYQGCSAPICPLDPNWHKTKHLKDERVCFYLCEAQKDGSELRFRGKGMGKLYQLIVEITPDISIRWEPIRKVLKRAANTGSRMNIKPPYSSSKITNSK